MRRSLEVGAASAAPEDLARSVALRRHAEVLQAMPEGSKRAQDCEQWAAWLERYAVRLEAEGIVEAPCGEAGWRARMRTANPRVVLRSWIAQEAIDAAEAGNMDGVQRVLEAVTRPFDEADDAAGLRYALPGAGVEAWCLS